MIKVCPNDHGLQKGANFCPECGDEMVEQTKPVETIIYLHGCKESNRDTGEELGLSEEAMEQFMYTAYEVGLNVTIDPSTGKSTLVSISSGSKTSLLKEPLEI